MKFYLPVGGVTDSRFGILTNYNHKAVPQGIINGMEWGGDTPVFGKKAFEPHKWHPWLETMKPYLQNCRFVSCPESEPEQEGVIVG